jgi:hypothetical protein
MCMSWLWKLKKKVTIILSEFLFQDFEFVFRLTLLGVQKSVREWTFTFPSELPFWDLES